MRDYFLSTSLSLLVDSLGTPLKGLRLYGILRESMGRSPLIGSTGVKQEGSGQFYKVQLKVLDLGEHKRVCQKAYGLEGIDIELVGVEDEICIYLTKDLIQGSYIVIESPVYARRIQGEMIGGSFNFWKSGGCWVLKDTKVFRLVESLCDRKVWSKLTQANDELVGLEKMRSEISDGLSKYGAELC